MDQNNTVHELFWVSSSKRDLLSMPKKVMSDFGYGLHQAQLGNHPSAGKVLRGFGDASVIELIVDDGGGTFRAVYTVKFR